MKKVEGYFDFRFTPDNKYTTGRKIRIEVTIKDEGFVENLQMIFYHLDKVVKKANLQYTEKIQANSIFKAELELEKSGVYWYCFTFELEGQKVYVFKNQEFLMKSPINR